MQGNVKNSYIQFKENFWQVSKTANFSTTKIALYFYLLHINNSCYWLDIFNHNNKAIEATLNISFKTLAKVREKLREIGLIRGKLLSQLNGYEVHTHKKNASI